MIQVIYDDSCSFCRNIKYSFNNLDYFNTLSWVSSLENKDQRIDSNLLRSTIVVIKPSNKILVEFRACRFLMTRIPFFYPIIILLYIPFISLYFGNKVYRIISKNRLCKNNLL